MRIVKRSLIHPSFCLFAFAIIVIALTGSLKAQHKQIVGWIEEARIYPGNLLIHAKLDTGAENSSLNARNITEFKRDGKRWVRFDVINRYSEKITIEKRVRRVVKVRCEGGKVEKRLAIRLGICLGTIYKEVEVNLNDRTGYKNQMLIGRSFMEGNVVVDSSLKYTSKPNCKEAPKP